MKVQNQTTRFDGGIRYVVVTQMERDIISSRVVRQDEHCRRCLEGQGEFGINSGYNLLAAKNP